MDFSVYEKTFLLFGLLLLFHVSDGVLKFSLKPPSPSYAKIGTDAKLAWNYSVDDKQKELQGILFSVEIGGVFTRMLVQQKDGTVVEHPDIPSQYSGRVTMKGNATLVILNVSPQDSRNFKCVLTPETGQIQQNTVELIVTEAPQISFSSVQVSYNEGSLVNISCIASGTPDPDVQWTTKGFVKSSGKKTVFLTFNSINRADDGQYTCKANNSAGTDKKDVPLVVHLNGFKKCSTLREA